MRIVIEGPDGSGKTTMVNRFQERYPSLDLQSRACSSIHGPLEQLADWVDADLNQLSLPMELGRHQLYDRHPLVSELIYSPALGRPMDERFQEFKWLTEALQQFKGMGYIVIYCLPPRHHVRDNVMATHLADTDHHRGVRKNIDRVYDLYHIRACLEGDRHDRFRWDYTIDDWDEWRGYFDHYLMGSC